MVQENGEGEILEMGNENLKNMDDIITEQELLNLTGLSRNGLDDLRQKHQLPFCRITSRNRVYIVKDVLNFIASRRVVLDEGSD